MLIQKDLNVITIEFGEECHLTLPSLHQWDKGQILKLLDVPDGAEVQYSDESIGNKQVKDSQVEIPDFLLQKSGESKAFIRYINENSETTEKTIIITVKNKPKPPDYIEPKNEQSFRQYVEEIMTATKSIAKDVQDRADNGEFDGADGYTPVKGKDYFTDAEINQIKNDTREQVVTEITPSLENNLKSAKDYTDNAIIRDFKDITYDETTATFIFTRHDDTTFTVDLPIDQTVKDGRYDDETVELVLVLVSGQEIRIPVSGLIDDYTGVDSATIQVVISADNKITCNIIGGTISKTLLTTELQAEIDGKANKSEMSNLVQEVGGKLLELSTTDKESYVAAINELKGDLDDLSSSKITKFYASNLGETHITDSDNGKFQDMMIYGRGEQFSTQGYNLLDLSEIKNTTQTKNGITIKVNEDCSINVEGTPTEYVSFVLSTFTLKPGTYYLPKISANYFLQMIATDIQYRSGQTFTLDEDKAFNLYFVVMSTSSTINSGTKIYPMILNGNIYSETNVPQYEPYTGGQPSPNPDYPQDIKSVVNPTVKVCGANLLNFDTYIVREGTANGITITKNSTDKTITYSGTPTDKGIVNVWLWGNYNNYINYKIPDGAFILNKGKTYYVGGIVLLCLYYDSEGTMKQASIQSSGLGVIEITPSFDYYVVAIRARGFSTLDVAINETVVPYVGLTDNPDEPYKEQVATLPYTLNAIPVSDGGNVTIDGQQYVADYVDVERKKLIKWIEEKTITRVSVGNYADYGNGSLKRAVSDFPGANYSIKSVMSNAFRTIDSGYALNACRMYKRDTLFIFVSATTYPTAEDFNKYLAENSVIARFILETPQEIDLTDEEIQSFKDFATYYPHTNVMVKSEQLDGYTTFNYPISMANGWNYVKEQLGDTREYIYDMELQSAEAYINSEYAVALSELEV